MHRHNTTMTRAAIRWIAALMIVSLSVSLAGCGDPYLQGGAMHFDATRYDRAAEAFEQAVAKNPEDATAHLWLARCYGELNRVPEAVLEFDRAASLDPSLSVEIAVHRRRYWRQQELRGESFLREAMAMPELSAQRAERFEQATAALQQAALLSNDSGMTYFQLYKLYKARGDSDEAMKNLNMAIDRAEGDGDLSGELVPVLRERGRQAVLNQDYREGVVDYSLASRLRPGDVDLQMDLASSLLLLAESPETPSAERDSSYREAGKVLEGVRSLRPTEPDALYNLATVRIRTQHYAEAGDLLLTYLALRPHDPEAWRLLSETLKADHQEDRARTADLAAAVTALNRPVSDTAVWARRAAERFGPATPLGALFAELGVPEEIHTIKEGPQSLIEVWFYIRARTVAAFQNGNPVGEPLHSGEAVR